MTLEAKIDTIAMNVSLGLKCLCLNVTGIIGV